MSGGGEREPSCRREFGEVRAGMMGPVSQFPIFETEAVPRITSLLIKPATAVCNLDCEYCFYLDREADPYSALPGRRMTTDTLERLVDTYLFYSYPNSVFAFQGGEPTLGGTAVLRKAGGVCSSATAAPTSR